MGRNTEKGRKRQKGRKRRGMVGKKREMGSKKKMILGSFQTGLLKNFEFSEIVSNHDFGLKLEGPEFKRFCRPAGGVASASASASASAR